MFSVARNHYTVFWSGCATPTSNGRKFLPPHILSSFCQCSDFGFSHGCVVASRCFHLQFPDGIWDGTSSHMLICYLYDSDEVSVRSLAYFFNWAFVFLLLSLKKFYTNSLCILDNSPFSHVSFVSIFSQSMACLVIHLISSLQSRSYYF